MKKRVLFVDDESLILDTYKSFFISEEYENNLDSDLDNLFNLSDSPTERIETTVKEDQFEIFCASQGKEAIEIVKHQLKQEDPIQVVFLDMRMPPGIDGRETAMRLRILDPNIFIVFVTAYSDHSLTSIQKALGASSKLIYLKKPFAREEIEQLANCLSEHWLADAFYRQYFKEINENLKKHEEEITYHIDQPDCDSKLENWIKRFKATVKDSFLLEKTNLLNNNTAPEIFEINNLENEVNDIIKELKGG